MSVAAIGQGIVSTGELPEGAVYDITSLPAEPLPEPGTTPEDEKVFAAPPPAELNAVNPFVIPQDAGDLTDVINQLRAQMQEDFNVAVADVERRLGQARELEQSAKAYYEGQDGGVTRMVHAEDMNLSRFMIDGYTLTPNSPAAGQIAWANLHVVLLGVDYTITNASTALKYTWFVKPGSYTPGTPMPLNSSDTMPVLGSQDALIFVNNSGVPISVLESSIAYAVGPGVIGNAQLDSSTQTLLSNLAANDIAIQSRIDGVITSYYQAGAPWPAGAASPGGGDVNMGDIWYDSDDGGAFRWTGSSGSPANTWQRIADTSTASIAAQVNTKTTTFLSALASPPAAPAGGFTAGDLWMVTDQQNRLRRWSGSAWVDLLIGDGALASGISGAKIGSGIDGANISTGTVAAARVGAGVNGAILGTATGTVGTSQIAGGAVGNTQLAGNAVTPAKINAAFHLLY